MDTTIATIAMSAATEERPAVSRRPVHTRQIVCVGYLRDDGLFDIEARLVDTRSGHSRLLFKDVPAGGAIHEMRLVVTVDTDLVIRGVDAHTDTGPTPYCAQINAAYARLVGVAFAGGFMKEVKARLGGAQGCAHLTELLRPIATTAFQTRMAMLSAGRAGSGKPTASDDAHVSAMRNTCHAWREGGEVMQHVRRASASAQPDANADAARDARDGAPASGPG